MAQIPKILRKIWPSVLNLGANEVLVLRGISPYAKVTIEQALRSAIKASESLDLFDDFTVVFASRRSQAGTYDIFIKKQILGEPVVMDVTVPVAGRKRP